jgi:hypothetical protein
MEALERLKYLLSHGGAVLIQEGVDVAIYSYALREEIIRSEERENQRSKK